MGQRKPKQDKANRICIYVQKPIAITKKERNRKEEEGEWQTHDLDAKEALKAWDAEMVDIRVDEGTGVDDLVKIVNIYHGGMFDQNEKETLIMIMK